ncbi:retinol dehydrogenase 13-like isoform X2 [Hetaerina americana]|uniref:retinol dehydrogenase 13-like isoform X2 n=1 Tax=Hetaerina americana TaxID=62018 RepID=UPI003A7F348B
MGGRLSSWWFGECKSSARLDGKVAIITGCNTGIGKETALDFVRRGCRVIMACRDLERANKAAEDVLAVAKEAEEQNKTEKRLPLENNYVGEKPKVEVYQLDLNSLESVREFSDKILNAEPKIHLLINNAGVMACPRGQTKEGHELQLGVNHLGHFLLTCLLLNRICETPEARIVNVSSMAHKWGDFDFDDMNMEKTRYSATAAYSRSKLANILFTKELAKRLEGTGVNTYALHPGVVATELGRHLDTAIIPGMSWIFANVGAIIAKSPRQGAQTTIYCAVDENTAKETGLYYSDCRVRTPSAKARDPEMARRLWEESLKMVGLKEDPTLNLPQKAR